MGKPHFKKLMSNLFTSKDREWFANQDREYLYQTIVNYFRDLVDECERTLPKTDLDILREILIFKKPDDPWNYTIETYSIFANDTPEWLEKFLASIKDEDRKCSTLYYIAENCISASSILTSEWFVYKEAAFISYKDYKPVRKIAKKINTLGLFILKVVSVTDIDLGESDLDDE